MTHELPAEYPDRLHAAAGALRKTTHAYVDATVADLLDIMADDITAGMLALTPTVVTGVLLADVIIDGPSPASGEQQRCEASMGCRSLGEPECWCADAPQPGPSTRPA